MNSNQNFYLILELSSRYLNFEDSIKLLNLTKKFKYRYIKGGWLFPTLKIK